MTRKGCFWFAGGVALAVLAGLLAFYTLSRVATAPRAPEEPARVPALVAVRDLPLQTIIGPGDVALRELPPEAIPEDGLADPQDAIGQLTTAGVARGEVILRRRLIKPDYVGPQAAMVMDPTKVIVALPAIDLLSSIDIVRPGDRVDLMFTISATSLDPSFIEEMHTLTVLQDVRVAAVVRGPGAQARPDEPGEPRALLLALDPQDALTLKYFSDTGGGFDLALRAPVARGIFDVAPVDGEYVMRRFKLQGQVRP